ncbi:MAG: DsrE family protein [Rhodovibrio sp.]|nr:DsrE family protein [Rhodovibrio sp.]
MQPHTAHPATRFARAVVLLAAPFTAVAMLAAALTLATARPAAAQDGFGDGPAKVVYHADFKDPRRFSAMLTSVYNMVTTYRNDLREYDVRIVFNSYGIRFLTDNQLKGTPFEAGAELRENRENLRGRLLSLQNTYDVKLELCDITRERVKLPKDEIYDGVESVASGVVRVAELQSEGFAYIKIE